MKNNTSILILLALAALFFSAGASAQQVWTLRDCIEYARQHNIQVQKSKLLIESYNEDLLQSRAALFPNLSGSVAQNYSNTKVIDSGGDYEYNGLLSGRYNLNSSWTLFNGGRTRNDIRQAELSKESQVLTTEEVRNDLEISITQAYLQILYARESIKNNQNILESSEAQLQQTRYFLEAGTISMSELAQVEAQYSAYKYNLVVARNTFDSYKLQLKQLLEQDYGVEMELVFPEIDDRDVLVPVTPTYTLYQTALRIMPEIENSALGIRIAEIDRASAKAAYLPTLAMTASLGTGNIYNQSPSFFSQLNNNLNQSAGLSLNIPIFTNRQNKTRLRKAELGILNAQLTYTDAQKNLLRIIENLSLDVTSAQSRFIAAQDQLRSAELSYRLVSEQFDLGMRNTVELITEKNNYANALQELLQAKYTALLSIKLLNFYQGEQITL